MLAPLCLLEELKKQQTIWLKDDPAKKEDYVRKMFLFLCVEHTQISKVLNTYTDYVQQNYLNINC